MKWELALRGLCFKPSDLFTGKRSYQSLPEHWIETLRGRGYEPAPVLVEAGTVLIVDTSIIHRARPCKSVPRYALTTYYKHAK